MRANVVVVDDAGGIVVEPVVDDDETFVDVVGVVFSLADAPQAAAEVDHRRAPCRWRAIGSDAR